MKMSNKPAKYELLIKQYLRSILGMSIVFQLVLWCSLIQFFLFFSSFLVIQILSVKESSLGSRKLEIF